MDNKIYIPYGITIEKEVFIGFGRKQIKQFFIGAAIAIFIAVLIIFVFGNMFAGIVEGIIGLMASFFATRKDTYSQSIVGIVSNVISFKRSQQRYPFVHKSWL